MSAQLESEHGDLLQFLYACPIGLVQIAADGTIGLINPLAMQLLLPLAGMPWVTNFFDVMEAYAPELRNMADAVTEPTAPICHAHRIFVRPASGQKAGDLAMVLACTMVKLGDNRLMATIEDVSKQVAQERRLKQAETWFASLIDGINNFAVLSVDARGCITRVNPSVQRQTGFEEAEVLGQSLDIFDPVHPEPSTLSTPEQVAAARRDGWHLDEGWRERRDGTRYWCQRLIAVQSDIDGENGPSVSGYTVVLRDVTRQDLDTAKLQYMLTTDYLTGAYNRAHFYYVADRERVRSSRNSHPLAVVAFDLDHFKTVNDSYGHGVGDRVLKTLSAICKTVIRPSDTFARIGGEEFFVLLPSTDLDGAGEMAERLRMAIAETPIAIKGGSLRISASFGCSVMAPGATVEDFLAEADRALYEAKRSGRNKVVLSSTARAVA